MKTNGCFRLPAFLVFTWVPLLAVPPVFGGYKELMKDFAGYEPPAIYKNAATAHPALKNEPHVLPLNDANPARDQLPVKEIVSRWERTLAGAGDAVFFTPDPVRLATLRPAADDTGSAATALANGFPLETIEILAFLRSPDVASKEGEFRAALEGYSQVENLDTVLRRYASFTASIMTGVGAMEQPGSMAKEFPFPGDLGLRGEVISEEARAARERLEAARRTAITDSGKAYWELGFIHKAIEITTQMLDLLDNLRTTASARYSSGEANFQDTIRVGIEQEKAKEDLKSLVEEKRNAEEEIRRILDLPTSVTVGAPGLREPARAQASLEYLQAVAMEKRQELRSLRAMVGRLERMIEMTETMSSPGFSQNLSLFERNDIGRVAGGMDSAETGSFATSTTAGMGAGLPKSPFYGLTNSYLRETKSRLGALQSELRSSEAATRAEVRKGWFRLDKARRETALYGERIVLLAQAAVEASTRGYSAGQVPFADVITSYTGWFAAHLSLARSRADQGIARAELENVVGARL